MDMSMLEKVVSDTGPAVRVIPTSTVIGGMTYWVNVHVALVPDEGRFVCVGLDVRSYWKRDQGAESVPFSEVETTNEGWAEITSPVMRGLQTAAVVDRALGQVRELASWIRETGTHLPEQKAALDALLDGGLVEAEPRRRGPKPLLDDAALRAVVVPAYRTGGRRPVQAVRAALLESGLLGGHVSIDQARKAVAAARARGFIPPAKKSDRHEEGRS
jgi:hypothetical protein